MNDPLTMSNNLQMSNSWSSNIIGQLFWTGSDVPHFMEMFFPKIDVGKM